MCTAFCLSVYLSYVMSGTACDTHVCIFVNMHLGPTNVCMYVSFFLYIYLSYIMSGTAYSTSCASVSYIIDNRTERKKYTYIHTWSQMAYLHVTYPYTQVPDAYLHTTSACDADHDI